YEVKARLRRASAQLAQAVEQRRPTRDIQLLMSLESTQDVITDRSAESSPAAGLDQSRQLLDQAIEELATADGLCREYGYDQLLAQVKVMEARVLSAQGFPEPSTEACWQGLTAALGTNRFVLNETWKAVEGLAIKSPGSNLLADMRQRLNSVAEKATSGRDAEFVKAVRLLCAADSDDEALRTENAQA
ncbi:MAG TPA: hypothetical protein VFZ12_04030, partial [Dehalococcoidia bacterium]|nr:hypothetical protein [Dehalococcoidia bacterium]